MNDLDHEDPKMVLCPDPKMVGKILLRAAEILEGGWCQHSHARRGAISIPFQLAEPGVDRFCLTGAIMKAVSEHEGYIRHIWPFLQLNPLSQAAYRALYPVIQGSSLTHWNDSVCPSGEVAAAVLRKAAGYLDR